MDTGGWETDVAGLDARVAEQSEIAIGLADLVMFIVDATVGATATDERVVQLLRKSGKPVLLVANKVDGPRAEADAMGLWNLGLGEPHPVSALHGRGTGDLLDALLEALPEESAGGGLMPEGGPRRVALVGRPNVGKSSLLNALAGGQRVVVDPVAGTTRDPVDELIELGDRQWWFVDTAGIRRRVHQTTGADFYASLRTQAAIEKAEVAVVLVDASESLTEQDTRVISQVVEAGRALVIAYNKWDLMDEERRYYLEREIEKDLVQVQWAPRVNISALTGWHRAKLVPSLDTALASWDMRVPTGGSTRSSASWSRRTRTRCAVASSLASCSPRRPRRARPGSWSSPAGSSRRDTGGSSSAACARRSASRVLRSRSRCASGRRGRASPGDEPAQAGPATGVSASPACGGRSQGHVPDRALRPRTVTA